MQEIIRKPCANHTTDAENHTHTAIAQKGIETTQKISHKPYTKHTQITHTKCRKHTQQVHKAGIETIHKHTRITNAEKRHNKSIKKVLNTTQE